MNPSIDLRGEGISALVRQLHDAMMRQRRGFPETIRFLEENIPSSLLADGSFHTALAEAALTGSPDLEAWALGRAAECLDSADAWSRLRECRLRMADYAGAGDADARFAAACLREGKHGDAMAALARCLTKEPGPEASRALLALALSAGKLWTDPPSGTDALAARRGLRKHAWYLLEGEIPDGDYNLAVIDMGGAEYAGSDGPSKARQAFQDLVVDSRILPVERLSDSDDFRVLCRGPERAFLADARQARPVAADPAIMEAAVLCAQFRFPAPGRKRLLGAAPESESRETLIAREGHALANLGLLGTLMGTVLGVEGFAHPDAARLMSDLARAGKRYAASGRNAEAAYGQLVHFFCATNAFSNAFLAFLIRLYNPPYPSEGCRSLLGHFGASEVDAVANDLKRDGIHIFDKRLPEELVDDLLRFARTAPCFRKDEKTKDQEAAPYPSSGRARGNLYDFKEADLIRVPGIQRIMADAGLYEISQAYFGAKPNLDAVQMWWSPVFDRQASSEAAQMYHFDLERVQWLKWFVYLTDVDPGGGPHCFVRGSHRTGRKPAELLSRGYQRIPDEDMARFYPPEDRLEITGSRGTMFVEDTSGWHKGKVPLTSDRLVLEIELSNTLFGTISSRDGRIPADAFPPLLAKAHARPQFLGKFVLP